jgi:BA14K-like protein
MEWLMVTWKLLPVGAVALAIAFSSAQAGPVAPDLAIALRTQASAGASRVQWRGRGWGWGSGPWFGLGLGAGIVAGTIIADQAYRPRPGHYYDEYAYDGPYYYPSRYQGDPRAICAQNFRSFEWQTGHYTTYSGERRLCPYLR